MSNKINVNSDIAVTSSSPDPKYLKKSWGYINAYPHEYLIHFRRGQFSQATSGQGASCFKWPRDMVFIIPTSLKEIVFQANQLSSDNVDLRLRGMAVYHIKEPLKIYTLLNFSNRQQAEEKLAGMIGDLCRSTAKWLVANMPVNECMRKRKEEIATALKNEVSRVVADPDKGWGVEIMTIDIQDVYIQDDEIFRAMQAQFKSDKIRESELTQLEMSRTLEIKQLENAYKLAEYQKNNDLERARIEAELKDEKLKLQQHSEAQEFGLKKFRAQEEELLVRYQQEQRMEREKQQQLLEIAVQQAIAEKTHQQLLLQQLQANEREQQEQILTIQTSLAIAEQEHQQTLLQQMQQSECAKQEKLLAIQIEQAIAEITQQQTLRSLQQENEKNCLYIQMSREREERQFALDHYRVQQNESIANYKQEQALQRSALEQQSQEERSRQQIELNRLIHSEEAEALRQKITVENQMTPAGMERLFIDKALPEITRSLAQNLSHARINIVQGDGGGLPLRLILDEAMELLHTRLEKMHQANG